MYKNNKINIISTQILELDKALNNFKDSKGEKVNFSKQKKVIVTKVLDLITKHTISK